MLNGNNSLSFQPFNMCWLMFILVIASDCRFRRFFFLYLFYDYFALSAFIRISQLHKIPFAMCGSTLEMNVFMAYTLYTPLTLYLLQAHCTKKKKQRKRVYNITYNSQATRTDHALKFVWWDTFCVMRLLYVLHFDFFLLILPRARVFFILFISLAFFLKKKKKVVYLYRFYLYCCLVRFQLVKCMFVESDGFVCWLCVKQTCIGWNMLCFMYVLVRSEKKKCLAGF